MGEVLVHRSWLAWSCALIAATGCAAPAQVRYEREVEQAAPESVHGVHSQRLVELMRGLERLRDARLPSAMDLAGVEAGREREIDRVSRDLAASARAIAPAVTALAMSDADRREFLGLAAELERRAEDLATAPVATPDAVRTRVAAIEETCQACHRRFRISGGPGGP
jgi:cytochrome c556